MAFCDTSLSFNTRAQSLVDSYTLKEKASISGNRASGIPRLNIPEYNWWNEASHGMKFFLIDFINY